MELPCQIALRKISKFSIVPKYTIIFSIVTFIISSIITITILVATRENFEMTFISRAKCFTNSLRVSIFKLNKIFTNNKKFIEETKKFLEIEVGRGNVLYLRTEVKKENACNKVKNPIHIIPILPSLKENKIYKTCFNIRNFSFYNYYTPKFYSQRLLQLEHKILILFLIGFFLYILIVYLIFKKLLSPIVCLSNDMQNITLGKKCELSTNLQINDDQNNKDEISNLIKSYCTMLNKIEQLQNEQIKITKLLHESEKYATIGKLVAGLAHEINNAIGGIKNSLYNLKKAPLTSEKKEKYISLIEKSTELLTELMHRLINFSHPDRKKINNVKLKKLIIESTELLKNKIKNNNIKLEINCPDNLIIKTNKYSLLQIFLNLLINSIDALKEKETDEKLIKISVREFENSIEIEFFDNGPGIPKEYIDKIFEPFFTTKKEGSGYGLGLFIVKGLVSSLNYDIKIESEVNKYTKIILIAKKV